MSSTRKRIIVAAAVVLAVVLLYPFERKLVPETHVLVVTNDMHPVRNALVRQIWQDYSLERYGHEEDLPTDANGRVTFPTRTIRAPLLVRLLGPVMSIAGQGVHASFGLQTDMFIFQKGTASTDIAQPQLGEIVYRVEL
ncbi:MAG: hypothetical protein QOE77_1959 [Blastocatellia bacterium]|jgi:hypothetical protein|nr:hypothetical protein [Blastocatellia bacterium]